MITRREYADDDLLMLSGIQHFAFCHRQWALIHMEQQWADNLRTYEGDLLHSKADNPAIRETRGKVIISRAMPLLSRRLGITGKADIVEFHAAEPDDPSDISAPLAGRRGRWKPYPIEYKRGKPKADNWDEAQLCAQAICLEEMLGVRIDNGSLFYGKQEQRQEVVFDQKLRQAVEDYVAEMRKCWDSGATPIGTYSKACLSCSLYDLCLPKLPRGRVKSYMNSYLEDGL